MEEVAQTCGASKVTIYKYFADKDTLLLHVAQHILGEYSQALRALAVPEGR